MNINEDFNLIDVYNYLIESRGVIDGCDDLFNRIHQYIVNVITNKNNIQEKCQINHVKKEKVTRYKFTIPIGWFKNTDTLFMRNPIFNISIFIMDNIFGDTERQLGECNYLSMQNPIIVEKNNVYKLDKPRFNLFWIFKPNYLPSVEEIAEKASHEIVHAKKNFQEYVTASKKRKSAFQRDYNASLIYNNKKANNVDKLVGRILYLCSNDEINARANQLYYQLKRFKNLNRNNVNNAVKQTNVYRFIEEFEENIKKIENIENENNLTMTDNINEKLKFVYNVKTNFKNPYEFLINLLINRKNFLIRQYDKVKEKILYELTLIPLKK